MAHCHWNLNLRVFFYFISIILAVRNGYFFNFSCNTFTFIPSRFVFISFDCIIRTADSASYAFNIVTSSFVLFLSCVCVHYFSSPRCMPSICLSIQFSINNLTSGNWWNKNNNNTKQTAFLRLQRNLNNNIAHSP